MGRDGGGWDGGGWDSDGREEGIVMGGRDVCKAKANEMKVGVSFFLRFPKDGLEYEGCI